MTARWSQGIWRGTGRLWRPSTSPDELAHSAYSSSCFLQSHHRGSGFSQWAARGFHWGKYAALTSSPCQPWLLLGIWYCVWDLGCIQLDWNVFFSPSVLRQNYILRKGNCSSDLVVSHIAFFVKKWKDHLSREQSNQYIGNPLTTLSSF